MTAGTVLTTALATCALASSTAGAHERVTVRLGEQDTCKVTGAGKDGTLRFDVSSLPKDVACDGFSVLDAADGDSPRPLATWRLRRAPGQFALRRPRAATPPAISRAIVPGSGTDVPKLTSSAW